MSQSELPVRARQGISTVYQGSIASGLVVEFNTFDGEKANHPTNGDMVLAENEATMQQRVLQFPPPMP